MRIIYHEGFDRAWEYGLTAGAELSGAYYLQKQGWPGIGAFGLGAIYGEGRRAGGGAMGSVSVSFPYRVGILSGAPRITGPRDDLKRVIVGGAWKIDDDTRDCNLFQIGDDDYGVRCWLRWNHTTDSIEVRDAADTVVYTATGVWDGSEWAYIEMDVVRNDTAGTVKVWLDDTLIANLTNINTGDETYGYTSVQFFPGAGRLDDFYVMDPEGAASDDVRLGSDTASVGLNPDADVSVDFTPLSGTDNFGMLDLPDNDADTSYNSTSTDGDLDLFTYTLPEDTTGDIVAVTVRPFARRPSGGGARVTPAVKIAGTTYFGANADTGDSSYNSFQKVWQDSPATTDPWTREEVAAASFGYKSSDMTDPMRVTMNVVEVLTFQGDPPPPPFVAEYTVTAEAAALLGFEYPGYYTATAEAAARTWYNSPGVYKATALLDAYSTESIPTTPPADFNFRAAAEAFVRYAGFTPEVRLYVATAEADARFEAEGVFRYTATAVASARVRLLSDGRLDLLVQDVYPR